MSFAFFSFSAERCHTACTLLLLSLRHVVSVRLRCAVTRGSGVSLLSLLWHLRNGVKPRDFSDDIYCPRRCAQETPLLPGLGSAGLFSLWFQGGWLEGLLTRLVVHVCGLSALTAGGGAPGLSALRPPGR